MNSRLVYHLDRLRCGYGINLEEQNRALDRMELFIKNLYWMGKESRLPFEHGILATIRSIRGLRKDLKDAGFQFRLTCRTNQDAPENFFSCLRGLSGGAMDPHQGLPACTNPPSLRRRGFHCTAALERPNVEPEQLDTYPAVDVEEMEEEVSDDMDEEEPLPSDFCPCRGTSPARAGRRGRGRSNVGNAIHLRYSINVLGRLQISTGIWKAVQYKEWGELSIDQRCVQTFSGILNFFTADWLISAVNKE